MSRLLFPSTVELLGTESTLGEFHLGEKPNLLRIELEKKIYAIKKVNPTTFGKQFHKKDAVKYISFCPLASYQRKGKEILQTVNKTLNSSGHFSKTSVAFASRLHRSPPGERICAPNYRNLSSCCVVRDCLGCDNLGLTSSFHNSSKIN